MVEVWEAVRARSFRVWRWQNRPEVKTLPAALPQEFFLFARYLQAKDVNADGGLPFLHQLVSLPPEERQHLSTWAAYRLGLAALATDPAAALGWFHQVRVWVDAGFADEQDLVGPSYNGSGEAYLRQNEIRLAVLSFLQELKTGRREGLGALKSIVVNHLPLDPAAWEDYPDRQTLGVLLYSYLASHSAEGFDLRDSFLVAAEGFGWADLIGRSRLAYLAYVYRSEETHGGRWEVPPMTQDTDPEYWLERADPHSFLTHWLRAKVLLGRGDLPGARVALNRALSLADPEEFWPRGGYGQNFFDGSMERRSIYWADDWPTPQRAKQLPTGPDWQIGSWSIYPQREIQGDLAAVDYHAGRYVEALWGFVRAGYLIETVVVAEQVLRLEELGAALDTAPDGLDTFGLRYLYARRLIREGYADRAYPYLPPELHPWLEELLVNDRLGNDESQPAGVRAEAFWRAARIVRHLGLELMGTELWPDARIFRGRHSFEPPDLGETAWAFPWPRHPEELPRKRAHLAEPGHRFHYRTVALGHAWAAAELMPDHDDLTALRLAQAGSWVKVEHPEQADIFYKALVTRCRETDLGDWADHIRWFPPSVVDSGDDFPEIHITGPVVP